MFKKISYIIEEKHKKGIIIFLSFSILIIVFELLSLGMLIPLVNVFLDPNSVLEYLKFIPNEIIDLNPNNLLIYALILFNILILLKSIILFFSYKFQLKFIAEINQKLQNKLFKHYTFQSITRLVKTNLSEINRNAIDLPGEFSFLLLNSLLLIVTDVALLTFILILLIIVEPIMTIMGSAFVISVGLFIFSINKKKLFSIGESYNFNRSGFIKVLNETFGAILEVKSLNKESIFINKFKSFSNTIKNLSLRLAIINFVPRLLFEIMAIVFISIFFLTLNLKYNNLNEMLGILVLFTFSIIKITPFINKILVNMQKIKYSSSYLDEIYNVLSIVNEKTVDSLKILKFENNIDLLNIDYKYDKTKLILKKINLSIKKNEFIVISGESGAGKSTLLKIILGLIKPINGNILVDNQPILSNSSQWQEKITFVPQDVFIFDDTLKNNITLEIDDDKVDFEKLESAIDYARIKNFSKELSKGYNTILGDKGARISGGQKQRIGIARALYANSEIIVFDESTSSVDEKNESEIFESLQKLKDLKTIIFVTHRKNIKKYCDSFYFLENSSLNKE